jgi:integrase
MIDRSSAPEIAAQSSTGQGLILSNALFDDALANAITLWAESSSDSESLRYRDLIRIKSKAIGGFFGRAGKSPAEISPLDVKAWREEMEAKGLAAATIYARLSHLSSFYNWLMSDPALGRGIITNPVRLARPRAPKAYQTESAKALSDDQFERLQSVIRTHADSGNNSARRDYALFLLLAVSGMRRAEAINLRGRDIELCEDGMVITCRVKGGDYVGRWINSRVVRAALIDYLTASGRQVILDHDGPLWVRHDQGAEAAGSGKPLTGWGFVKRMKAYAREAGLRHFHLHQTRHTFARIAAEVSGSIYETQEALGHKNPATTRHYIQRIAVKRDRFGDEVIKRIKI